MPTDTNRKLLPDLSWSLFERRAAQASLLLFLGYVGYLSVTDTSDTAPAGTTPANANDGIRPNTTQASDVIATKTQLAAADPPTPPARSTTEPLRLAETPRLPPMESTNASESAKPAYRDQLIDPGVAEEGREPSTARSQMLPGAASAEYRYLNQINNGIVDSRYIEHGVSLMLQQDTQSFGRFEVRGDFTSAQYDPTATGNFDGGHFVNVAQRDFPLTGNWLMNNEVGDIRARVPDFLAQGYRVRLPEPLIEGVATEARSKDASIRVVTGTLGVSQGLSFPVFSTAYSSGSITGLNGSYRPDPNWSLAGQAWQTSDALTLSGIRSFTSYAGTARYADRDNAKAQIGFLSGNNGAFGLWLDTEKRLAGWQHNAGVYRMDPNLDWVDRNTTVLTDMQGAYWRGATRSFLTTTSLGIDWSRSNVDDNPLLSTRSTTYGYGNIGYRMTPTLNLDGHLAVGQDNITGTAVDTQDTTVALRAGASNRYTSGTGSFSASMNDRSGSNTSHRADLTLDYFWNSFGALNGLRSGASLSQQSGNPGLTREVLLRGGAGWNRDRFSILGAATIGLLSNDVTGDDRSASATLSLGWQLASAWRLSSDFTYNENALTSSTTGVEQRVSNRQFRLSVRYNTQWGEARAPLGLLTGQQGSGEIRGILFLDKNGNGVRDPGESGAGQVTLSLDNVSSTETNANGEFSFVPVMSGEHRLTVNIANIPLPWRLDERRTLIINVRPRTPEIVEIPLVSDQPG